MTDLSPAPGTPQTGYKAYVSAALAFVTAFGAYYVADEDPFTQKELIEGLLLGLVASGLTGGGTFLTRNAPKGARGAAYVGIGTIAVIVLIVLLLIWLF